MIRSRRVLMSAALAAVPSVAVAQTLNDTSIPLTLHATGFTAPTGIEFLGRSPTDFFVIEKNNGQVRRYNNGSTSTVLDLAVALDNNERGLLGITKDPNFATNNFVYLYYSKSATSGDSTSWQENRLSRFTWNGTNLTSELPLRVFGTSSDGQPNGANHNAGPIIFGPDGKLYGTTGDLNRSRAEQNNLATPSLSASVGGIYRLNTDGSVPSDNPFNASPTTAFHQWYAYGVRNTFGLNFDPLTGALWDTENGPNTYDEINRVDPGFNSGWNKIMGPDSRDPQGIADLVHLPGSHYSDPEFSYFNPVAPTGLEFFANTTLDLNYRDALVVGDSNNGQLYLFRLNANRDGFTALHPSLADLVADDVNERNLVRFGQNFSQVSHILTGPDGGVYVVRMGNFAAGEGSVTRIGGKSWKTDNNGTFSDANNWQGGVPSNFGGDDAHFFDTISAPRTITHNVSLFLRSVNFHSDHRYTLTGMTLFSLGNGGTTPNPGYLRVLKGSHTITGNLQPGNNLSLDILPASSVMTLTGMINSDSHTITKNGLGAFETQAIRRNVPGLSPTVVVNAGTVKIIPNATNTGVSYFTSLATPGGKFDLTNNTLILSAMPLGTWNGSNYTGVTGMIKSGRNNGAWNGNGIITSRPDAQGALGLTTLAAATASQVLEISGSATGAFAGQTVTGTDTLVRYTLTGDANLDRAIDGDDYFNIDNGYTANLKGYFNGDFDLSGLIDADDYFLIDRGYARQTTITFAATDVTAPAPAGVTSVPEPAAATLLLAAAASLPRRRRR